MPGFSPCRETDLGKIKFFRSLSSRAAKAAK
jgi:hypothetical protein